MRTVAAVTVARSDYGILRPVLRALAAEAAIRLRLVVGGAHHARAFGTTVNEITADGFQAETVEMLLASDTPTAIATSMGVGIIGFASAYERLRPDVLLLTGDRFEMLAAAVAALPFTTPIAHIHGGELSLGAVDNQNRHAISKIGHLHFVSTEQAAKRLLQMGEEQWRITVTGAPSLDNLRDATIVSPSALAQRLGIPETPAPLLVTYHPATIEYRSTAAQVDTLLAALADVARPIVITYPNADMANQDVIERIKGFASRPNVAVVQHLGTDLYFSAMRWAAAMVGNSSSGIVEAASFRLPVVNIGSRQEGRDRPPNVIDVPIDRDAIRAGIDRALSKDFRASLADLTNPYGDGHAAERIVHVLATHPLDASLLNKRFVHLTPPCATEVL